MLISGGAFNRETKKKKKKKGLPELNSTHRCPLRARTSFNSLRSAYSATPTALKIIDLYVGFVVSTAIIQVVYMALVGAFPFNSFLSGVLSCIGTVVLAAKMKPFSPKLPSYAVDCPPLPLRRFLRSRHLLPLKLRHQPPAIAS